MSNPMLRFAVTIEYVVRCFECGAEHRTTHPQNRLDEILLPSVPREWTCINGVTFCPLHEITIDVRCKDAIRTRTFGVTREDLWEA